MVPLGLGIVLGNLLGGVPIDSRQEFTGSLGDLLGPYAVATGVTITIVCLLHGAAFLALRADGDVRARALGVARTLGPIAAAVVLVFVAWTRIDAGHGVLLSVVELGAVLAAIAAAVLVRAGREGPAFAATSATMAAVVISIFSELYPRVMVSSSGAANDLTVTESAASPYALRVMTVALALLFPVVLAYQGWTYHVFRDRIRSGPGGGRPAGPATTPADTTRSAHAPRTVHTPGAPAGTWPPQVLTRLGSWLLAWLAALFILRLRAAIGRAYGAEVEGTVDRA